MSHHFKITFLPEEIRDYEHQIVFITENEHFALTLLGMFKSQLKHSNLATIFIAIGPRPLLEIPDEIFLPGETLVKTCSEKKIWCRNIGGSCARFSIITKCPFEVSPDKSTLAPNETMALSIFFKPTRCGVCNEEMIIYYESGERLCVKLEAVASEGRVYLEDQVLTFRDTYEGLSDQKTIKLYNKSNCIMQYSWKLHASAEIEKEHADRLKEGWRDMKDYESLRGNKLETFNIIDYEGHRKVYDRIYTDEIEEFELNDQFLYTNKIFKIEPIVGLSVT